MEAQMENKKRKIEEDSMITEVDKEQELVTKLTEYIDNISDDKLEKMDTQTEIDTMKRQIEESVKRCNERRQAIIDKKYRDIKGRFKQEQEKLVDIFSKEMTEIGKEVLSCPVCMENEFTTDIIALSCKHLLCQVCFRKMMWFNTKKFTIGKERGMAVECGLCRKIHVEQIPRAKTTNPVNQLH
jgi:hypothetical protein